MEDLKQPLKMLKCYQPKPRPTTQGQTNLFQQKP
jgi:hypothetical protein